MLNIFVNEKFEGNTIFKQARANLLVQLISLISLGYLV